MTAKEEQVEHWCSVDIEKSKKKLGKGVFAVSVVLAKSTGEVLNEARFTTPVDIDSDSDFDDSTRQFWSQHPAILERLNKNTRRLTAAAVRTHLLALNDRYGPFNYSNFRWICDNPAYDIGEINTMLLLDDENSVPLSELFGSYVATSDPTEQYNGLLKLEQQYVDSQLLTPHSHDPVEDARRDIEMMFAIKTVLKRRAEHDEAVRGALESLADEAAKKAATEAAEAATSAESDGWQSAKKRALAASARKTK